MTVTNLAVIEQAIEPYKNAGYIITSQTDSSIQTDSSMTLQAPARRFSWITFLLFFIVLWPVALIYVVWFNLRGDRSVCVRVTSQGYIETTGFTLEMLQREKKRRFILQVILAAAALIVVIVIAWLLYQNSHVQR